MLKGKDCLEMVKTSHETMKILVKDYSYPNGFISVHDFVLLSSNFVLKLVIFAPIKIFYEI